MKKDGMDKGKLCKKSFRITEEQLEYLEQYSSEKGICRSEGLRRILDRARGRKVSEKSLTEFLITREFINEINKIGVNINQIAKNTNTQIYRLEEKKALIGYMKHLNTLMTAVLNKVEER